MKARKLAQLMLIVVFFLILAALAGVARETLKAILPYLGGVVLVVSIYALIFDKD